MLVLRILLLILSLTICVFNSYSQGNYFFADSIAAKAKGSTVENLHKALTSNIVSDEEKLRAFYSWIARHINYDVGEWVSPSGNWQKQEPEYVFKNKVAVCHGYSELFKSLCDRSDIKCYLVSGYPKRNGAFVNEGHTWNVVFVNNKWLPVDVTWGAGGVTSQRKFEKEFDDQYFLTNPVDFLSNHYPFDPMWQLVPNPVKLSEYKKQGWKYSLPVSGKSFNYADTIAEWELRDSISMRLLSAQRIIRMNPDDKESQKEYSYALFDAADAQSMSGMKILSELYPESKTQRTTAVRANISNDAFRLKLDEAYQYFSNADSILSRIVVYNQNDRNDLANAKRVVRHNLDVISSERNRK